MKPKAMFDMSAVSEDDRVTAIGQVVGQGKTVNVLIDDEPNKVARYIKKVTTRFPFVAVLEQAAGPVQGVRQVVFGPVSKSN